ncbi:hypothetical protein GQ600_20727 [Phytophthora cactorum]|nr:hypothetical protein GQ600_20727 [Phytophthora cactorum]
MRNDDETQIDTQINESLPKTRDEDHATELFNMGYNTLRLMPSKRKRITNQIKLTAALRFLRQAEGTGTRSSPTSGGNARRLQTPERLKTSRACKRVPTTTRTAMPGHRWTLFGATPQVLANDSDSSNRKGLTSIQYT